MGTLDLVTGPVNLNLKGINLEKVAIIPTHYFLETVHDRDMISLNCNMDHIASDDKVECWNYNKMEFRKKKITEKDLSYQIFKIHSWSASDALK